MKSERLIFSHYNSSDFDDYYRLVGNAEVMKMITGRPLSESEARDRFEIMLKENQKDPKVGHFKVIDQSTGECLGHSKLEMIEINTAEIGYVLFQEYWKMGYGNEIAMTLVKLAREVSAIQTLIAIIDPVNTASKRILTSQGFEWDYEGDYFGLPAFYYKMSFTKNS